jgi:hypothetical protein
VQAGGGIAQAKAAKEAAETFGNRPTESQSRPTPLHCASSGSAQRRT